MPPPGEFTGSAFRLETATPIGLATIRLKYTQDPKFIDAANTDDALNIDNYTLTGPLVNYVIGAAVVVDDPQAVDLYLAAPLEIGEWTIAAANVEAENGDSLLPPTSLTFTVEVTATQSPISGGALN